MQSAAGGRRTLLYILPSSAVNTMDPTMVAPMHTTATGPNCGLSIITTARLFCKGRCHTQMRRPYVS
jgi:hypothetical protein